MSGLANILEEIAVLFVSQGYDWLIIWNFSVGIAVLAHSRILDTPMIG